MIDTIVLIRQIQINKSHPALNVGEVFFTGVSANCDLTLTWFHIEQTLLSVGHKICH